MPDLKISLITVCYNAESTIRRCIISVIAQNYQNIEYIIIDGGSTDGTLNIISEFKEHIHTFKSGPDDGMYDAMNKGIKLATGDIIGMLNADDFLADDTVIATVAAAFTNQNLPITFGDLDYIDSEGKIIRKWRSGKYRHGKFNYGWMPPHPTFYCKRELFDQYGFYSLKYGTAADYELMSRFMHLNHTNAFYINKVLVKMNIGGASNKSYGNRVKGLFFDLKAMRSNGILVPIVTLIAKPLRKINQYF
ncbi:glycosyltransferase family 2 protein [soil metagenome]